MIETTQTSMNSKPNPAGFSLKREKARANTIIVSDIHLGSNLSRVAELKAVLESWTFERLILLGDVFDNLNFHRLNNVHWEFLTYVKQLSKHKEVVWIEGNHDEGLIQLIPYMLDVKAYKEYSWEYNGKKYLAMHGHQFDDFIKNNSMFTGLACKIHELVEKIDTKRFLFSRFLARKSTTLFHLSKKVASDAIRHAVAKGVNYVFCGHTHEAMSLLFNNVHYYNSGCWTDFPSNYISIGNNGVQLHQLE